MSESNGERRSGGGFFTGFLFGTIAGGAIAYLILQEEARDAIVGKAREAGNFALDATGDLRGRVSDAATTFQAGASDLYTRGKGVVDSARGNVGAAVDEGRSTADQLRTELRESSAPAPQTPTPSDP